MDQQLQQKQWHRQVRRNEVLLALEKRAGEKRKLVVKRASHYHDTEKQVTVARKHGIMKTSGSKQSLSQISQGLALAYVSQVLILWYFSSYFTLNPRWPVFISRHQSALPKGCLFCILSYAFSPAQSSNQIILVCREELLSFIDF